MPQIGGNDAATAGVRFLADSGSVAVEVAMKMALQYWQAKGEARQRFLTFRNGYHGDTFGAMSVCDPDNSMHSLWKGYLPENLFAPAPQSRMDGEWDERDMVGFARLMAAHRHEIAAVIIEPIVRGAGGMRMYHPEWLKRIRKMCDREGILLIADGSPPDLVVPANCLPVNMQKSRRIFCVSVKP